MLDAGSRGYPLESFGDIPQGDYYAQAVFNVYTTFPRVDGHTILAHMDRWEGQRWNRSPGNLIGPVDRVHIDPREADVIRLTLDGQIPPLDPPQDTEYLKHIKFRSDILSAWWGHDMDLGAVVVATMGSPKVRVPFTLSPSTTPEKA